MEKCHNQKPHKELCSISIKPRSTQILDIYMDRDSLLEMASILAKESVDKHKGILRGINLPLN